MLLILGLIILFYDDGSFSKGGVWVAGFPGKAAGNVCISLDGDTASEPRCFHIGDQRQWLVGDGYLLHGSAGDRFCLGNHDGDGVTDKPGLIPAEDRLVRRADPKIVFSRNIPPGEHVDYPGHSQGVLRVNLQNFCMGMRGPVYRAVQAILRLQIAKEFKLTRRFTDGVIS